MPRNSTITPMCMATLKVIVRYHDEHKYSPSFRDVADILDELRPEESDKLTSTNTVSYHIRKLIALGYLEGDQNRARAYAPTDRGRQMAASMVQEGHAYLCGVCNLVFAWYQVQKTKYFLTCPQDGNAVIDITYSERGTRFLERMQES